MTKEQLSKCTKGEKVTYIPGYGKEERGIIKSITPDLEHAFVVYNCAGNWEQFEDYTAARTRRSDLELGWRE